MSANPYDRRTQRGNRVADNRLQHLVGGDHGISYSPFSEAQFRAPPTASPSVAMDDLNAMACSAFVRGQMETEDRLREQHAAEMLTAQRIAWHEGHERGTIDGRDAHIKVVAGVAVDIGMRLIEVTSNDRATRSELRAVAAEAKDLAMRLAAGEVG